MGSPSIIFNCKFCPSDTHSEENSFFRCKTNFNIIDYEDRTGAADKSDRELSDKLKALLEDSSATGRDILGYEGERPGSTGIFTKNPEENTEEIKNKLHKTPSIVWHAILSFTPEIGDKFCSNKADAEKILRENLPALFKSSSMDYENINWHAALHTNTENHHIHFSFWEDMPSRLDKFGNPKYTQRGMLSTTSMDAFKASIIHSFSNNSLEYLSFRGELREGLLSVIKSDKSLFNRFVEKADSIIEGGHFQYARLDKDQKKLVDDFVNLIMTNNTELRKKHDAYTDGLMSSQAELFKLYRDNHIKNIPDNVCNFYSSRKNELDARLGNTLLKQLKTYSVGKTKLEEKNGYVNGAWQDSKLSPKNRKAIIGRGLSKLATSVMNVFFDGANESIEVQGMSDEEYKQKLIQEQKATIYD
ncbi:MAG: hypothetical protein E7673_07600 [Ruminococcaceae bacterium]|nr:hypothetical protein [Oscillospiraceae bacterium]